MRTTGSMRQSANALVLVHLYCSGAEDRLWAVVSDSNRITVAPRCNESQEFRFFGELSFVTARFWKKFLIARSVCVGAGV